MQGSQQMVAEDTRVPHIWREFPSENRNKADPFAFLFMHIVDQCKKTRTNRWLQHTQMSPRQTYISPLAPCNHKRADTRLFAHDGYGFKEGWWRFLIHDIEPDVITITVSIIPDHNVCIWTLGSIWNWAPPAIHLWLVYCNIAGRSQIMFFSYMPCIYIYRFWYCLSLQWEDKTVWDTWKSNGNLTESFHSVTIAPNNITSYISTIEHFNLLLCNRTSSMLPSLVDKGRGI